MFKAYEDFDDKVSDGAKKQARSYAKKKARGLRGVTSFFCILALAIGFVAGNYGYEYLCKNDTFSLVGEAEIYVELNAPSFSYEDSGVQIIEFGRDISEKVQVETNMTDLGGGKYTADTTVPGRYYIKYTVESPKYGEICRIRTFVVGGDS